MLIVPGVIAVAAAGKCIDFRSGWSCNSSITSASPTVERSGGWRRGLAGIKCHQSMVIRQGVEVVTAAAGEDLGAAAVEVVSLDEVAAGDRMSSWWWPCSCWRDSALRADVTIPISFRRAVSIEAFSFLFPLTDGNEFSFRLNEPVRDWNLG